MITIVPYDASWPEAFVEVARPLRIVLGHLALRIDHMGSTAVPGLAAKDRIDVQVTIQHFDCTPQVVTALGLLGYTHFKEYTSDHRPPLEISERSDRHIWQLERPAKCVLQDEKYLHERCWIEIRFFRESGGEDIEGELLLGVGPQDGLPYAT